MSKNSIKKNYIRCLKFGYYFVSVAIFLGGVAIYAFFRNINNMIIFQFFPKPLFLNSLYTPLKTNTVWSDMFIFNLPYGLWCFSGLLFIRAIWINNIKWRQIYGGIFIAILMFYVILKLPKVTPGTFDVLDLLFMGFFAFIESIIFNMFIRRYL